MHPPLRIELPDHALAELLCRHLQSFDAQAVTVDGGGEVRIQLTERNPESKVAGILKAIGAWLPVVGIPSVRLHLGPATFRLHQQPSAAESTE